MEPRKMVLMNLFAGQQWRHGHREQTCEHREGVGGEGGTNGECSMETHTTMSKTDSQGEFAVCLGELKLWLCV